jgi:hypothetical protein
VLIRSAQPGHSLPIYSLPAVRHPWAVTVTVRCAYWQVRARVPGVRILVCAPSNSAADIFVARLADRVPPSEMLRLNAWSRDHNDVPDAVRPYTTNPSREAYRGEGGL